MILPDADLGGSEETSGTLLDGRISYSQPSRGYRTGIEPVLLAAAVPACAGERVLEAGTGAGAGLLCLTARVSGLTGAGVERDQQMAALARRNLDANDAGGIGIEVADICQWRGAGPYAHAFANPPWHQGGSTSPEPGREAAKRAQPGLLQAWTVSLGRSLVRRGTLSFVLPAAAAAEAVAAMIEAKCGEMTLIPLWPHSGEAAKLVIVRGVREGKGGTTLHPGLVLHDASGAYTKEANAILRSGAALL